MNFIKKYLKIFIGVAVLVLAVGVFFFAQQSGDLEGASLKKWRNADLARRSAAVQILVASDEYTELLVQCVDKIASLPDSSEMAVKDAVSLCYTGIQLKENN